MKNVLCFLVFSSLSLFNQNVNENLQYQFDTQSIVKTKVCSGEILHYKFPFQNIGDSPLIVQSCKSSCGCLVPFYPQEPILPNEYDTIYGWLNTEGKIGMCHKSLMVTFQTIDTTVLQVLSLKCEIDSCVNKEH